MTERIISKNSLMSVNKIYLEIFLLISFNFDHLIKGNENYRPIGLWVL